MSTSTVDDGGSTKQRPLSAADSIETLRKGYHVETMADTVEIGYGFIRKTSCPTCGTRVERGYNSDTFWCPQCNVILIENDLPAAVRTSRVVGAFEKITPLYWLQNAGDIYHAKSDYISQRAAKED